VFLRVDSQGWVAVFNVWASHRLAATLGQLSVDGKSIKCTGSGGQSSEQNFAMMVSLYGQHVGVVGLALMFNKKTSEIAVARSLLAQLPAITGKAQGAPTCISLDALHAQVATLELLQRQQVPYLVGLKANQHKLYQQAEQLREQAVPQSGASEQETTRNRLVHRSLKVYAAPVKLSKRWSAAGIEQIVWIERRGERDGKAFCEQHYFLSNRTHHANVYRRYIRDHWQIENGLHWVKDVTFKEDYPPRQSQHAPTSWAVLHSFIISIARRMGARTVPEAMRLLANRIDKVFHWLT
jgi:predicted transposase YbfD/YdcC